jgi:DeoR/GlpR family transcriptional regulator of sugar metabolism
VEKERLIEVIESVEGVFTISEKIIFVELVKVSTDNQVVITTKTLKELTALSPTTVHTALKFLQSKHYIKKTRRDAYEISSKNVEYITQLYQLQKKYTSIQ